MPQGLRLGVKHFLRLVHKPQVLAYDFEDIPVQKEIQLFSLSLTLSSSPALCIGSSSLRSARLVALCLRSLQGTVILWPDNILRLWRALGPLGRGTQRGSFEIPLSSFGPRPRETWQKGSLQGGAQYVPLKLLGFHHPSCKNVSVT